MARLEPRYCCSFGGKELDTIKKRQEEATSKETLQDLEETSKNTDADTSDGPSPDGALDEADELKDADPV
jgi:putative NADPH-quinone reductase